MEIKKIFRELGLETGEEREKFVYGEPIHDDDEINVDGLGLSTNSE